MPDLTRQYCTSAEFAMSDSPVLSSSVAEQLHLFPLPIPENVVARPLTRDERTKIDMLGELQFVIYVDSLKQTEVTGVSVPCHSTNKVESGRYPSKCLS